MALLREIRPCDGVRPSCERRCGHISFTDGQNMFVWGGYNQEYHRNYDVTLIKYPDHKKIWIYHTAHNAWTSMECTGDVSQGVSGASCALNYPYLYVLCGHERTGHTSTIRRMDLVTFDWVTIDVIGPMISPRDKFSAWVYNDKIYCFGGYGPDPSFTGIYEHGDFVPDDGFLCWNNQVLVFDPSTSTWTNPDCRKHSPAPLPRAAHATLLVGDRVFLFGGRHRDRRLQDLHCLDMRTMTWSGEIEVTGPKPVGRSWHTFSQIDDDRLFLFGGLSTDNIALDDTWIFSMSALSWTLMSVNTGVPRLWHTAISTNSSQIFAFGGCSGNLTDFVLDREFSNSVIKFVFKPPTLLDLSLEKVYECTIESDWEILPKNLQTVLMTRLTLARTGNTHGRQV